MVDRFGLAIKILTILAVPLFIVFVFGFLIATIVVLSVSTDEHPNKPLRVWLGVSLGLWFVTTIMQCIPTTTHIVNDTIVSEEGGANPVVEKIVHLACVAWWAVGLYWMISGGEYLLDRAPILFWYTAVILGLAAAGGVIMCCLCSCMICCGSIVAGILLRVNGAKADDTASV